MQVHDLRPAQKVGDDGGSKAIPLLLIRVDDVRTVTASSRNDAGQGGTEAQRGTGARTRSGVAVTRGAPTGIERLHLSA
jgi:hypothetical protein